jgi:hypothetical protein
MKIEVRESKRLRYAREEARTHTRRFGTSRTQRQIAERHAWLTADRERAASEQVERDERSVVQDRQCANTNNKHASCSAAYQRRFDQFEARQRTTSKYDCFLLGLS